MHAGFSAHVSDAGQARSDVAESLAGNPPLIGRARRIGIRGRHESRIAGPDHCEVLADGEDAALVGLQCDFRKLRCWDRALADINPGSASRVFIGGNHDRRSQPGCAVAQTRREIRSRGILSRGGLRGHNDPASDVIGDSIAVGILKHPSDGEWVCDPRRGIGGLRRLESKCAGYSQREQRSNGSRHCHPLDGVILS